MSEVLGEVRGAQQRLLLVWAAFALSLAVAFLHTNPAGRAGLSAPTSDTALHTVSAEGGLWRDPAMPRIAPAVVPQRSDHLDSDPPSATLTDSDEWLQRRSDIVPSNAKAPITPYLVKAGDARAPPVSGTLR